MSDLTFRLEIEAQPGDADDLEIPVGPVSVEVDVSASDVEAEQSLYAPLRRAAEAQEAQLSEQFSVPMKTVKAHQFRQGVGYVRIQFADPTAPDQFWPRR